MADKDQVTRHGPVTTTVELTDGKDYTFSAVRLPWRKRNDFGEALNNMYSAAFNEVLQGVRDDDGNLVGVKGGLFEAALDYPALFHIAYSTYDVKDDGEVVLKAGPAKESLRAFNMLAFDEMIEVLVAALDANGLERLGHLLDPDRKKDLPTGESEPATAATTDAGEKMESATDSG